MRKGFSSGRQRRRNLRGLIQLIDHIPRQQLIDAVDRMIRDALEDVMEITLRVDVIEFTSSCRAPDYAEPSRIGPAFPGFAADSFGIV
jgi:hypothetical protein